MGRATGGEKEFHKRTNWDERVRPIKFFLYATRRINRCRRIDSKASGVDDIGYSPA
jgi:hypothetical protein